MISKKAFSRAGKPGPFASDLEKDIEEAKSLRDFERLEGRDFRLWLLSILLTLGLTFFVLVESLETLKFFPGEIWEGLVSLRLTALILPAALFLLACCAYLLFRNREIRLLRRGIFVDKVKLERAAGSMEEMAALYQISLGIGNQKEFFPLLETIARESLNCLKAHRSTVFLLEEKSGILKTQFTFASDPSHEQVGLFEEKEVARKVLRQKKPFLLREPGDFSEFLKYQERERKITSLIVIPLICQGQAVGALSLAVLDEERKFSERDFQFCMVLANQASTAMEYAVLSEEVRKQADFRRNYERHLDHILNQLQTLSDVERRRIEDHIGHLLPLPSPGDPAPSPGEAEAPAKGLLPVMEPMGLDRQGKGPVSKKLQVDLEGETLAISHDLGDGGVFIRTPNPLDLGEEFLLKVHLADGEPAIEVACRVIWTNKYGKESRHLRRGMGVKFLNLSSETQSRVEAYIRSHKNNQFSFAEDQHGLPAGN